EPRLSRRAIKANIKPASTAVKVGLHPFVEQEFVCTAADLDIYVSRGDGLAPSWPLLGYACVHFGADDAVVGFLGVAGKQDRRVDWKACHYALLICRA